MLLNEQEIMDINQNAEFDSAIGYARAIESAVLEKLKAQEPFAYFSINDYGAWEETSDPTAHALYEHPDPRVAELEAVLRECRGVLSFINRLDDDRDFLDQPEYEQIHKAIAKIDEVLK